MDGSSAPMGIGANLQLAVPIAVEICSHCGGAVKVIPNAFATLTGQALACIEDQQVIDHILTHLKKKDRLPLPPDALPEARA
ncbi:MAG: hypothetical protein GY784_16625, partial [Gammaproteobacteria bacterium]|nr:hypothetical protein [Gammaproteobacteria bacterium]